MASSLEAASDHYPLHSASEYRFKLCYLSRTKLCSVSPSQLTFSNLLSLVAQAFPDTENVRSIEPKPPRSPQAPFMTHTAASHIELSYRNEDGDNVAIDGDESLTLAALSFQQSHVDVIKLHITVNKNDQTINDTTGNVQTTTNTQSRIPCRRFPTGSCRLGSSCTFLHQATRYQMSSGKSASLTEESDRKVQTSMDWQPRIPCRHFQAGSCRFGSSCAFLHLQAAHNEVSSGKSGSCSGESEIKVETLMNRQPRIP
eukprot:c1303_g1_i2 orf=1-768(-)